MARDYLAIPFPHGEVRVSTRTSRILRLDALSEIAPSLASLTEWL